MIITALALPVLLGRYCIEALVPQQVAARGVLVWSHGTLLGLVLIPHLLWGLHMLGLPLSFWATAALTCLLIVAAIIWGRGSRSGATNAAPATGQSFDIPVSHKLLYLCLLLLIVLRVATLGLEVFWRPLFPWDATMHWASKGRVWFEHKSMVPFVDQVSWLRTFGEGVYHDRHPDYSFTIPLLQVWVNLGLDRWDESMMNLPWVLCFVAMGGAFYAQLRNANVSPTVTMVFTYFLLSMPLINTHVALAGYADLFLGAMFCCALMALHNWSTGRQRWQALLILIFAIAGLRLKTEGYLWALAIIPGVIVATASSARRAIFLLGGLAIAGLTLVILLRQLLPDSLHPFLQQFTPFSTKGLLGLIKSVWLHDNWHLFTYLLPASVALAVFLPLPVLRNYTGIGTTLAVCVSAFLFLFLFTVFSQGAANFTGVGRLSIQLAPGLLFFSALLCNEIMNRGIKVPLLGPVPR